MMLWLNQMLVAIDQLANAFLGGYADETLSARAYRMQVKGHKYWGWTAGFINTLFFWQNNHCRGAYHSEVNRKQYPPTYYKDV